MTLDISKAYAEINALVGQAEQQKDEAVAAAIAPLNTQIATLSAQIDGLLHPKVPTIYGVDASNAKQQQANGAAFSPVGMWRYYQNPNEPIAPPAEYALTSNQLFAYSHKRTPQEVLTGSQDGAMAAMAKWMGNGIICPLRHEMEDDIERGDFTLAEFLEAQDRMIKVIRTANPKILIAPILMDFTIRGGKRRNPKSYLPADFDILGTDAYLAGIVDGKPFGRPVTEAATLFDPTAALAKSLGKKWGAFEVGVGKQITGQTKLDAVKTVSTAARLKGAFCCLYFQTGPNTPWTLTVEELAAWRAGQAT